MPYDSLIQFARGYATYDNYLDEIERRLDTLLQWRQAEGVDTIVAEWSEDPYMALFTKYYQTGHIGYDEHGHPVIYERLGRVPLGVKIPCKSCGVIVTPPFPHVGRTQGKHST